MYEHIFYIIVFVI